MCRVDHETETVLQTLRTNKNEQKKREYLTIKTTKMATKTPIQPWHIIIRHDTEFVRQRSTNIHWNKAATSRLFRTHYKHTTYTAATRTPNMCICDSLCVCGCVCAFWKLINVCFCSSYLKRLFWCVSSCECAYVCMSVY